MEQDKTIWPCGCNTWKEGDKILIKPCSDTCDVNNAVLKIPEQRGNEIQTQQYLLRRESGKVEARLKVGLSPQFQDEVKAFFRRMPNFCPQCGWTHPSDMWQREENIVTGGSYLACMKCGYILQEKDLWPEQIGE